VIGNEKSCQPKSGYLSFVPENSYSRSSLGVKTINFEPVVRRDDRSSVKSIANHYGCNQDGPTLGVFLFNRPVAVIF
jgi:hypothetical protein